MGPCCSLVSPESHWEKVNPFSSNLPDRVKESVSVTCHYTLNTEYFPSVLFKGEIGSWQEQQHQASARDLCFVTALGAHRFLLRQHATLALPWVVIGSLPNELGKE